MPESKYRQTLARYGLDHPTWDGPDCFSYATAEEARAGAIRVYGEGSRHVVVGPCDALLDELESLRGVVAAVERLTDRADEDRERSLRDFGVPSFAAVSTKRLRAALATAPTEEA